MTLEQAKECAKNYLNNEDNKSVFVTSDYAVYLNSDINVIKKHCQENKLELFILKGENLEAEKPTEEIAESSVEEAEKPTKKGKKS